MLVSFALTLIARLLRGRVCTGDGIGIVGEFGTMAEMCGRRVGADGGVGAGRGTVEAKWAALSLLIVGDRMWGTFGTGNTNPVGVPAGVLCSVPIARYEFGGPRGLMLRSFGVGCSFAVVFRSDGVPGTELASRSRSGSRDMLVSFVLYELKLVFNVLLVKLVSRVSLVSRDESLASRGIGLR